MQWKKGLLYGVVLWCVMFAVVSAFIGFKVFDTIWGIFSTVFLSGVFAFLFGGYVMPRSEKMLFCYGVLWAVIGILLDFFITTRFDATIFTTLSYWSSYALVILAPILRSVQNEDKKV